MDHGFSSDALEQLRRSEARWRSMVAALAEGIVYQDNSGVIETCNPAAERILGLTKNQMMGRDSIDPRWRSVHEDGSDFPGETHPAMVTLRTGAPQEDVIMGVHKPDGTLTWISINTQPVFIDAEDEPQGVVASFVDITHLKETQKRMVALELENERSSMLRSFFRSVSHDIRTPISVIGTSLYLLQRAQDDERRAEKIEQIDQQLSILTQTLDSFGLMVTLDAMKTNDLQRERTHINDVVERAVEKVLQASESAQAHIELSVDLATMLPPLALDDHYMQIALEKLIDNAIKFSNGKGAVYIRTRLQKDSELTIDIVDSGSGISETAQAHIFERLFKGDIARSVEGGGTGLGLSIAQRIVQLHSGEIEIHSLEGAGTIVTVRLPLPTTQIDSIR